MRSARFVVSQTHSDGAPEGSPKKSEPMSFSCSDVDTAGVGGKISHISPRFVSHFRRLYRYD